MIPMTNITGRLGNQMFQFAKLYSLSRDVGTDFYFQDPSHFEKYSPEIKQLYGEGIGYLPYVAIHLRVGGNPALPSEPNYIDNPFYTPLVKTGYYIKALEHFPHQKFIVFSDNIEFAKTYFEGGKFSFDESPTDLDAFNKMASCHHQIIANSSYSWWAAYLNPMTDKKVICPREDEWYSDGVIRTKVPPEWLQIKL